MEKNAQARKYLITLNNPIEHGCDHDAIRKAIEDLSSISYYCMADEIGNDTGTYHTHVFIYSKAPVRFGTIKNKFPSAHIEKALGSCIDNRNYILKEGKWKDSNKAETALKDTFEEYGVLPSERAEKEPELSEIINMFDNGASVNDVINSFPKYALRVSELERLHQLRRNNATNSLRQITVTYIYGPTGTGKTYSIYKRYDYNDVCRITNYAEKGLFDGYKGQSVLVFDEFHSQIALPQMLTYLDVYPVSLPARYYDRQAMYTEIYIISNIPLTEQYSEIRATDSKTWEAFERRINKVYRQIGYDQVVEIKKGVNDYAENPFIS